MVFRINQYGLSGTELALDVAATIDTYLSESPDESASRTARAHEEIVASATETGNLLDNDHEQLLLRVRADIARIHAEADDPDALAEDMAAFEARVANRRFAINVTPNENYL